MRGIKHVLTERLYAWEDARELAKSDSEIDLSGQGPAFTPSQYLEEELPEEQQTVEAAEGGAVHNEAAQTSASLESSMIQSPPPQEQQQGSAPKL